MPGGIFQMKINPEGVLSFEFLSKGMIKIHLDIDLEEWKKNPKIGFNVIHPDDIEAFKDSLMQSYKNLSPWYKKYRTVANLGEKCHMVNAKPEKLNDGSVVWYGSFQNITNQVQYELTMEQIAFDISHVLRKSVTNLLGLTSLITDTKNLDDRSIKEYSGYISTVANELEKFIRNLNDAYNRKRTKIDSLDN